MNIFVLDKDPRLAALYHNDRHVVKMILESAQILSTAHVTIDGDSMSKRRVPMVLRPTHVNHPCVKWASATSENYDWLHALMRGLLDQYETRYHKQHAYAEVHRQLNLYPWGIKMAKVTDWVQCMPDKYRCDGDAVTAYRRYYVAEKKHIASWKIVGVPTWWRTYSYEEVA